MEDLHALLSESYEHQNKYTAMNSLMKICHQFWRSNKKYTGNFDRRSTGKVDSLNIQTVWVLNVLGGQTWKSCFDIIMCLSSSYWRFHPFWMNFWNWNRKRNQEECNNISAIPISYLSHQTWVFHSHTLTMSSKVDQSLCGSYRASQSFQTSHSSYQHVRL